MKIRLMEIPEEGLEIRALADADPWLLGVVKGAFKEDYQKGSPVSLEIQLIKTCDNVSVTGSAIIDLNPLCARCLETFRHRMNVPLHIDLAPLKEAGIVEGDEIELETDDLNFAFYKGEEIDLGEIIREMLVLDVPLRYLCKESCKGLCPQCGQNLNLGTCACVRPHGDPRLTVLKKFLKT